MKKEMTAQEVSLVSIGVAVPMMVLSVLLMGNLVHGLVGALLICGAMLTGVHLGWSRKPKTQLKIVEKVKTVREVERGAGSGEGYLRTVLDELAEMQGSEDLLGRYRCFANIIEICLRESLGGCRISLWSPDQSGKSLVECMIRPSRGRADSAFSQEVFSRRPCRVLLDSAGIKHALKSGEAYLADPGNTGAYSFEGTTIKTHACIPLYREHGQPLLINVELLDGQQGQGGGLDFRTAVDLISLVWNQLQATNQRQWAVEHDELSGVLRDDAFLAQSQLAADSAMHEGKLFGMAVITIKGFRGMFAGHSRQWRDLTGLLARCINETLKQQERPFLLGRTADDVFALMLHNADDFLAEATLKHVMQNVDNQLPSSPLAGELNMDVLELRWAVTDQRSYKGKVQQQLDRLYDRLFSREVEGKCSSHKVRLQAETVEV